MELEEDLCYILLLKLSFAAQVLFINFNVYFISVFSSETSLNGLQSRCLSYRLERDKRERQERETRERNKIEKQERETRERH